MISVKVKELVNIKKDIETINKNQSEMKNMLEGINIRLDERRIK